ncbi:MAG: hypothetical protein N2234_00005, partial [Planctomycetota bacterium]|nr:hypothetical protein [Planctomycetota bacterium]
EKEEDETRFIKQIVEANTKKKILEEFERCKGDSVKKYEILLDALKNLPTELVRDRESLWSAVSVVLNKHQNRRLFEWFVNERKLSLDRVKSMLKSLEEELRRFKSPVGVGGKKGLSEKLLSILGFEK